MNFTYEGSGSRGWCGEKHDKRFQIFVKSKPFEKSIFRKNKNATYISVHPVRVGKFLKCSVCPSLDCSYLTLVYNNDLINCFSGPLLKNFIGFHSSTLVEVSDQLSVTSPPGSIFHSQDGNL